MKKPSLKDIETFSNKHDRITVECCRRIVEYGKTMIEVMNDTGVSDEFDFEGMAITSVKNRLKWLLDEVERLEFEHYEVESIIPEITRPKGS